MLVGPRYDHVHRSVRRRLSHRRDRCRRPCAGTRRPPSAAPARRGRAAAADERQRAAQQARARRDVGVMSRLNVAISIIELRCRAACLPRLPRDDARRSPRARGDAAVLHRVLRQPGLVHASVGLEGAGGGRAGAARSGHAHRRARRARSSSRAAPPNRTTWRSQGIARRWPRRPAAHRRVGDRAQVGARERRAGSSARGWRVTDAAGRAATGVVDLDGARRAVVDADTALVSVMAANNEIGVVQPLAEIGAIARARGRALSRRCRAGRRQDPDRRQRDADRSAVAHRPQDVRAEGLRRALRPQAHGARAADSSAAARSAACDPAR